MKQKATLQVVTFAVADRVNEWAVYISARIPFAGIVGTLVLWSGSRDDMADKGRKLVDLLRGAGVDAEFVDPDQPAAS